VRELTGPVEKKKDGRSGSGDSYSESAFYSGDTDVLPQSSQRRYSTGNASERPMTRALGTPQRGQTIPEVDRLAIGLLLT